MSIKKTTLHPQNDIETDLYPKTSIDQVDDLDTELDKIPTNLSNGVNGALQQKQNYADGEYSFAGGIRSVSNGLYSFTYGYECTSNGTYDFTIGVKCINDGILSILMGDNCKIFSSSSNCFVFGYRQECTGNHNILFGYSNISIGSYNNIIGFTNNVNGNYSYIMGYANTISNSNVSVVLGSYNVVNNAYSSYTIGLALRNSYQNKTVLGCYNQDKDDTLFEFGCGDSNVRRNGFEITRDFGIRFNRGTKVADGDTAPMTQDIGQRKLFKHSLTFDVTHTNGNIYKGDCEIISTRRAIITNQQDVVYFPQRPLMKIDVDGQFYYRNIEMKNPLNVNICMDYQSPIIFTNCVLVDDDVEQLPILIGI